MNLKEEVIWRRMKEWKEGGNERGDCRRKEDKKS